MIQERETSAKPPPEQPSPSGSDEKSVADPLGDLVDPLVDVDVDAKSLSSEGECCPFSHSSQMLKHVGHPNADRL